MLEFAGSIASTRILGHGPRQRRRMMRARNLKRGIAATLCWALILAPTAAADEIRPDVTEAFATVRGWLDSFEAPSQDDRSAHIELADVSAACVVLRRAGRVMGIGIDASADTLAMRRAAGRAMNEVLADPTLQRLSDQIQERQAPDGDADQTVQALRTELGRKLVLEVEVAGPLTPLIGRTLDQAAATLQPGLDGVALRRGDSWEFLFPSVLRVTNTGGDPAKLILNLLIKAQLPVRDFAQLAHRTDVGLYSFRTINLMQASSTSPPTELFRGDVIVPQTAVTDQTIAKLANDLAMHMVESMWPEPAEGDRAVRQPLGIRGDYITVADEYRPLIAPPLEQALAALALHRYARTVGVDPAASRAAADAASRILVDLAEVVVGEEDPRHDPAASAMLIAALAEQPALRDRPSIAALFHDCAAVVAGTFDAASGFMHRGQNGRPSRTIPPNGQALLAWSMTRLLTMSVAGEHRLDAANVRQAIDAAWSSVPEPQQVALLPWIGWAESEFAAAAGQSLAQADQLRMLAELLAQSRVTAGRRSEPGDLDGGFGLTLADHNPALATAQTVRPAAWLAGAIQNPAIVPTDRFAEAHQGHLRTVRFLHQLSIRETALPTLRAPQRALGGIRTAMWDSDLPLPGQALALITMAETLQNQASDR